MSACLCNVFGRALWDDDFIRYLSADPVGACRIYEGPTTQANGLRALEARDFEVLAQQLKSIRTTLGAEVMHEVADNFGLQMILGRAMIDQAFAKRLEREAESVVKEFLGDTPSMRRATGVLQSAQFKKLNGFAAQREAMREVGQRFSLGVAHGRARTSPGYESAKVAG
jgi:hypothetical protein